MPRPPRKNSGSSSGSNPPLPPVFVMFAEVLGEAIARNLALAIKTNGMVAAAGAMPSAVRRRGRPPKSTLTAGPIPAGRMCTVPGCGRESRSKGLCSAHYQAERRRSLAAHKA